MIFAYGDRVPANEGDLPYHGTMSRGVRSTNLFRPRSDYRLEEVKAMPSVETLPFFVDKVPVPHDRSTTYWCEIHKLQRRPKHQLLAVSLAEGRSQY